MMTKVLGACLVIGSLTVIALFESSSFGWTGIWRILHWPAITLTGVGPLGVVLLCSEWKRIRDTWRLLWSKSPSLAEAALSKEALILHQLSQRIPVQGSRALEGVDPASFSPFNRRVMERLSLRMPIQDVRDLLERERDRRDIAYGQSLSVLNIGVRIAPSMGMLGTILGMVQLLSNLKDPSDIGSHMGLALLTTFFGLFFSLLVWTPLGQRLEALRDVELQGYDQTLHWLDLLEKRKPAQYFMEDQIQENAEAVSTNRLDA